MPYMNHPSLFDAPYASGSDTSRDAAIKAQAFIGLQGEEVMSYLRSCGAAGSTQKEAAAWFCPHDPSRFRASMCARFNALEKCGRIRKVSGLRRDGCAVYVVCE